MLLTGAGLPRGGSAQGRDAVPANAGQAASRGTNPSLEVIICFH